MFYGLGGGRQLRGDFMQRQAEQGGLGGWNRGCVEEVPSQWHRQTVIDHAHFVPGPVDVVQRVHSCKQFAVGFGHVQSRLETPVGLLVPVEACLSGPTGLQCGLTPAEKGATAFENQAQDFAAVLAVGLESIA